MAKEEEPIVNLFTAKHLLLLCTVKIRKIKGAKRSPNDRRWNEEREQQHEKIRKLYETSYPPRALAEKDEEIQALPTPPRPTSEVIEIRFSLLTRIFVIINM
ncbi:hypothetical protein CAEBREN_15884 [Caenorhabditis brenneri]|uniref:Uncharacterized protein n=1 Tax=Caenorhabditis brenneri TaxID=135651 RepID=G0N7G0_CAEBE|nr:hypothetical protein CAEBREN_15884 [Caenorhabditis brenneri]